MTINEDSGLQQVRLLTSERADLLARADLLLAERRSVAAALLAGGMKPATVAEAAGVSRQALMKQVSTVPAAG